MKRHNLGIDSTLANPPSDHLRVLRAEIEDDDFRTTKRFVAAHLEEVISYQCQLSVGSELAIVSRHFDERLTETGGNGK